MVIIFQPYHQHQHSTSSWAFQIVVVVMVATYFHTTVCLNDLIIIIISCTHFGDAGDAVPKTMIGLGRVYGGPVKILVDVLIDLHLYACTICDV